jgi:phospholipid/cholesterol/gamma-HCH transport system substrate-binding protein
MAMNERVMQFRIGMFVIVAGLVLTMLIVWFGESPQLFRDHVYVVVHFQEAPGVAEGIAVRKSGIRVGEVTSIVFDDRPNEPDGVLVTLSLERKYKIKAGSIPQLSRSLIGDVTIDLQPGTGPGLIPTSKTPAGAPVIEGSVAADPSKALAAATQAFQKAGSTLESIDLAASGIAKMTNNAEKISEFLKTWDETGKKVASAASKIDGFIAANQNDFQPAVSNMRQVAQKLNETLDPDTQAALKSGIDRFSSGVARFDANMASSAALFRDLGSSASVVPSTDFGQVMRRLNVIAGDVGLLTRMLNNGQGGLNPDGSIQKMIMRSELHDNMNRMALTANDAFMSIKPILSSFKVFADKVARDPGSISRGALQR